MKYKKYSSYKDSGVEWLGEIPESWDARRLGFYFKERREKVSDKVFSPLSVTKNGIVPQLENAAKSDDGDNRKKVCKGDFVINSRSDRKGSSGLSQLDGSVSLINTVIEPKNINENYIHYLLKSQPFQEEYYRYGKGIVADLWSTNYSEMKNIIISSPTLKEQQQIANFLDKATAKIDTLIEKQTKQIELLKEKRQAVISHAVTKGINPNVPMKDSGVEWLGEIPDHWEIKKAKNIASITRGAILRPVDAPEYFDENGEWAYLNISDATKCDKYLTSSVLRLSKLGSAKSARVYEDNVIITASATIGKAFINKIKVCVHDGFIPFCNIKISKDFLYHYLSNPYLYLALGKSNTQKNIYLDEVKQMMITIPSNEEQILIVKYIEDKTSKIDTLIEKSKKSIELLKEKRTALISAAVTGKIDVRELV